MSDLTLEDTEELVNDEEMLLRHLREGNRAAQ